MPTLLDDALVTDTLHSLPGWRGGTAGISRDVHLSPELDAELRRQVAIDATAMGHQPVVETISDTTAGGTRFSLSTPESGGVTELDIAFASHISDLAHRLSDSEPGIGAVRGGAPVVIFREAGEPDVSTDQRQP